MAGTNVVILDRGNNTTLSINLLGATIVSWRVKNKEQLYVSKDTIFDNRQAIIGGISFVFPKYEYWTFGPECGFARITRWNIEKAPTVMKSGDIEVILSLKDNSFTHSMWSFSFLITYRLILRENELRFYISVKNLSSEIRLIFDILLNMHFRVPDVRYSHICGLYGCTYFDKNNVDDEINRDDRKYFCINNKINRMYVDTPKEHTFSNMAGERKIKLTKENFPDTVVWNPWDAQESLGDSDEEFLNMLNIGVGYVKEPKTLYPDHEFEATQILKIL